MKAPFFPSLRKWITCLSQGTDYRFYNLSRTTEHGFSLPHGCMLLREGGSEMQAPLIIAVACLISCAPHWKITSYYLAKIRCRKSCGSQEQFQLTFSVSELPAIYIILTDKTKGTETVSPGAQLMWMTPNQGSAPHSEVLFQHPNSFYTQTRGTRGFYRNF